ncbi:MAG: protein-L-isoaspartate(D-aspartate) O-methyltransferase [Deltaproteobacteria bacterium]|nr:protein-L-isoaspartate(D-aspartate) O-methyltransferase [Deltaproteobacteria bacterium]
MIREQLVPRGIIDPAVIAAIEAVPRHLFVEDALQGQAYGDFSLPIGDGQTISQPFVVGLMTQALHLSGRERVLEIGTGCGYQTAILSMLCDKVYTVERVKPLFIKARRNFDQLHYLNIICKFDDGTVGWAAHAPYDAIIVTAAGPAVPESLLAQLADPGIMVIPVGSRASQTLKLLKKKDGIVSEEDMENVRFVKLIGREGW